MGLFTYRFFPTNTLKISTSYTLRDYYYYGIPELDYAQLSLNNDFKTNHKQRLGRFNFDLGFYNHSNNDLNINYRFNTGISYIQTYEKFNELTYELNGEIKKVMTNNDVLSIDIKEQFFQQKVDSASSNNLFKLKGRYLFNRDKLHLRLGINAMFESKNKTFLIPDIYAEKKLIGSYLIYYNGWEGSMILNNMSSLLGINPYMSLENYMLSTRHNNKFSGIKGHFNSKISYKINASFDNIQNAVFFRTDSNALHSFQKETTNVDLLSMSFEISIKANEKFELTFDGIYYDYDLNYSENLKAPWHMPDLKLGIMANYKIADKININSALNYWGSMNNLSFNNVYETLPSFIDANFHVDYHYRENISFKIMLNNLLGNTYNRWSNYPVVGFNGMACIQFSF